MRILVTGGCGFIGSHIVEYHLAKGDEVTVIDNLTTGSMNNLAAHANNPLLHIEIADILDAPNLLEMVSSVDRIYHMAAVLGIKRVLEKPVDVLDSNILGTARLLHVIAESNNKPRIMIASSSSVYGHSNHNILRENDALVVISPAHPLCGYAVSKITDEIYALAYHAKYQLPITLMRFFNTIGPRQTGRYGMVVPRFVQQACLGEPITVYGTGEQTRSFCDVRDTVNAIDLLAENEASIGEIVNVGLDKEITINELAAIVRNHAQSKSSISHVPYSEVYGHEFTDITQRRPDISKLFQLTHFHHQWNLESTVDSLISAFEAQK